MGSLTTQPAIPHRTASSQDYAAEVVQLFAAYPRFHQDAERLKLTIAGYVDKLREYPLRIVSMARRAASDKGGDWPPSAGDLRASCERILYPCGRPPRRGALPPPRVSREEARRVGDYMHGLAREMADRAVANPEAARLNAEADSLRERTNARFDASAREATLGTLTEREEQFLRECLR